MAEVFSPGLEGVIAGETAISPLEGGLSYRGYPVVELVERCNFEEVAYLLLHGELPTKAQLDDFKVKLIGMSTLPPHATDFLEHPVLHDRHFPAAAIGAVPWGAGEAGAYVILGRTLCGRGSCSIGRDPRFGVASRG